VLFRSPGGYECNAESQSCVSGNRDLGVANNNPTDPPPTFVCLLPQTQCPNYKCCDEGHHCAELAGGNYKCIPRSYSSCFNGTGACPENLFCHSEDGVTFCAEEVDTDPKVKEDIIRQYWGDSPSTTCNSLIQTASDVNSVELKATIEVPSSQFWYPKKLVVRSKATTATTPSLPTLMAAKVCQHLSLMNSSAATEFCFISNANGHFLMKERDRVQVLVSEYSRRLCNEQRCIAPAGKVWLPIPEELDPCPCRERPTPLPLITSRDDFAGSNDEGELDKVLAAEATANSEIKTSLDDTKPAFLTPVSETPDEKPVTSLGMGGHISGAVLVSAEVPIESATTALTLVQPVRDQMQLSSEVDSVVDGGDDIAMVSAKRAEIFMGKESCEDDAEAAVDLDGDEAIQLDASMESIAHDTSLSQMEANTGEGSHQVMPEVM